MSDAPHERYLSAIAALADARAAFARAEQVLRSLNRHAAAAHTEHTAAAQRLTAAERALVAANLDVVAADTGGQRGTVAYLHRQLS